MIRLAAILLLLSVPVLGWAYGVIGARATPAGAALILPEAVPDLSARDPLRVLVLGTSLTRRGDWTERLGAELDGCGPAGVVVERLARAGAASGWGRDALRARLAEGPVPGLLIVEFAINDASPLRGRPLALSRRSHEAILAMAGAAGIPVFLATMNPAFGGNAVERPGQARYAALYRDLASETGAGLIDTIPDWLALAGDARKALLPDGLHPTPEAMERITIPAFEAAIRAAACPARADARGLMPAEVRL